MRRNLWSVAALAVVFALGTSATSSAGGARNVTITVRDAAGAPVADARVLIAADEMDAVGTTDAAGQVRVTTGSRPHFGDRVEGIRVGDRLELGGPSRRCALRRWQVKALRPIVTFSVLRLSGVERCRRRRKRRSGRAPTTTPIR